MAEGEARDLLGALKEVALPSPRPVAMYHTGRREGDDKGYLSREAPLAGQATRGWELRGTSVRASDARALRLGELLERTMEVAIYREQDLMHL